ncbi:alkaline phosphatase family protein [Embleya sp. NPDC059237]|uniref:alkaline phosphatase family protein n=1 Tax=Embleya sp. NPDC059237 TaxID=3346784 RepID=UPI0036B33BE2
MRSLHRQCVRFHMGRTCDFGFEVGVFLELFDRLDAAGPSRRVYCDPPRHAALTGVIHAARLRPEFATHFLSTARFFEDARTGRLPAYSFIEPQIIGHAHNDMHPPAGVLFEAAAEQKARRSRPRGCSNEAGADAVEAQAGRGQWFCALAWARALGDRGRQGDAWEVLAPYVATDWWAAVVGAAGLPEGWGRVDEAIDITRKRMEAGHPKALDAYTRPLARHGRAEEAFNLLVLHGDDWVIATALVDVAGVAGRAPRAVRPTRTGVRIHYAKGDSQGVTPRIRCDVHDTIAGQLAADWPPYVRSLIDRGLLGRPPAPTPP